MAEHPVLPEASRSADADPRILDVADDTAGEILAAIASSTARQLLRELHASPAYAAELAEAVDTSVQNVHYHLERLASAGAVEVVDTTYSEKGREMAVYAPTAGPLVLVSGEEGDVADVVEALSRLLGAVGGLALLSVGVQWLVERLFYPGGPRPIVSGGGGYALPPMTNAAPPVGLLVFAVGLALLLGWAAWRGPNPTPTEG